MDMTPDELARASAAEGGAALREPPVTVNVHVTRPSLEDFYAPPSLRPRPGLGREVCACDCGSKSGGGSGG